MPLGARKINAQVTGVCPSKTEIIAAASGYSINLLQVVAANLEAGTRAITFYEGETEIAPQYAIGGSGTLFWDEVGGEQYKMPEGSGLFACLDVAGQVDATVYYRLIDDRAGITKEAARSATYIASLASPKAIRTPNRRGNQQEG